MRTSLSLIDPAISEDATQVRVVNGFYGLQSYADDYWFRHLVRYIRSEGRLWIKESVDLFEELRGLLIARNPPEAASLVSKITPSKEQQPSELELISRYFEDCPAIQSFLRDVMVFRNKLVQFQKTESYEDGQLEAISRAYELKNDPSVFSKVRHRYQDIVSYFLEGPASKLSSVITNRDLDAFREIYGVSAFQCRYYNCPQTVKNFAFKREREEHEKRHARLLRCADLNCAFYAPGFKSLSSLKNHNAKYHAQADDGDVPDQITFTSSRLRQSTSSLEHESHAVRHEELSHNEEPRSLLRGQYLTSESDATSTWQESDQSLLATATQQQQLQGSGGIEGWRLKLPYYRLYASLIQILTLNPFRRRIWTLTPFCRWIMITPFCRWILTPFCRWILTPFCRWILTSLCRRIGKGRRINLEAYTEE